MKTLMFLLAFGIAPFAALADVDEPTPRELAIEASQEMASVFKTDGFYLAEVQNRVVVEGVLFDLKKGVILDEGDEVVPGTYFTFGAIVHDTGTGLDDSYGNTVVTFGDDLVSSAPLGVECPDGYYACCGDNSNGQPRAKCIKNGQSPPGGRDYSESCISGGEPATSCQMPMSNVAYPSIVTHTDVPDLPPNRGVLGN